MIEQMAASAHMVRVVLLTGLASALCACSLSDGCKNTVLDRVPSPDGKLYAVLYERDCGATTAASIHMSVNTGEQEPAEKGNALIASKVALYSIEFRPRWIGNTSVHVALPHGAEIYRKADSVDGVKIETLIK